MVRAAERAVRLLLVEDNPGDVQLTREAFREVALPNTLDVARDGAEALQRLRDPACELPDLIVLDLNLPRISGRELLKQLKSDPKFSRIPIVILTTSDADEDIRDCYENHANCYICKPIDLDEFFDAIHLIARYWFSVVTLPNR